MTFNMETEEDDIYKPDEWHVDIGKIDFIRKIGAGSFGEVSDIFQGK